MKKKNNPQKVNTTNFTTPISFRLKHFLKNDERKIKIKKNDGNSI